MRRKDDDRYSTANPYLTGGPFITRNGYEMSEADKRSVRSAALLNIAAQTWREARARLPEDASEEERLALIETVIAAFPEIDAALKKMEPGADEGDDGSAGGEF
jgi:hypothetical protein